MSRTTIQRVMLSAVAVAGGIYVSGCATKGYVNDRIDEVAQKHDQDLSAVQTETAALRNSTEEALARAETASGSAEEARAIALGKAGLEEVNRYTVYFAFNSDQISDEEHGTLNQAAQEIGDHPEVVIDVYGFADQSGPDRYNLDLGQRRASEVVRYLSAAAPNQLSRYAAVSFGERDLAGMSANTDDRTQERRVVVSLIRRIPLGDQTPPTAQAQP